MPLLRNYGKLPTSKGKVAMTSITTVKLDYEKRTGKPVRVYRAYPLIGRGSVIHDWIPTEEVNRRFEAALKIPLLMRIKWWLGGNT